MAVRGVTLVVNATPVGLDDESVPVDVEQLDRAAAVLDLVVGRNETPLVRAARARGHRAADGLEMLLAQGALAFERWFGVLPDRDAMRQSLAR
jgi:shikimate dehydrogenase